MNAERTLVDEYMEDKEFERLMMQEDVIMEVTEDICGIMDEEGINRSTLAKIMGKTKGYISQVLNGRKNLTIRSMVDIAYNLGYEVHLNFRKRVSDKKTEQINFTWDMRSKKGPTIRQEGMADDYHIRCPRLAS
jgi:plasmid maintenance system antidote protein VapI